MTVKEMEARLVVLGLRWHKERNAAAREEYRRLYPMWLAAKNQGTLPV